MTGGREKKPRDYEIPDRGRTQKRVFDDTEPLIVDGRPLEPEVTMGPKKEAVCPETKIDHEMHLVAPPFRNQLILFGLGALGGIMFGILLARAFTSEPPTAGLHIEPLTQLQVGTITHVEPQAPNEPVLLSIDFGPLGAKSGRVDIRYNQRWRTLQGRKVAAIVGHPVVPFPDQLDTEAFVIGIVDLNTENATGQRRD